MAKKESSIPKINPIRQEALEIAKKADKSLGYNSEIVDELGIGSPVDNNVFQKTYQQKEAGFFDPYEDYIDRNTLRGGQFSIEDLNSLRAEHQSNWEQAGHAVARVATNVIPQIVSGYASMTDIQGYWDAEHAANNKIVNWAMDLKKEVDEDWFPIYEENPGTSLDMSDFAWWMSRGSGLVESIGSFLAQGAGIGKGISLLGKGIGGLTKGKKLYSALEAIPGVTSGAKTATNVGRKLQTLTSATMLNQSEAVIEATQVFKDTYDNNLAKGYSIADAKKAAAEAASTTMNLNRINILLNLTSAAGFLTPMKGVGRNLLKAETLGTGLKKVAGESGQEAIEELVNHVASKKGMAVGERKNYGFADALKDMGSMEGLEAAFLGAIGGMAQTGGTQLLQGSKYGPGATTDESGNKISARQYNKDQYNKQQEIIEDLKSKGVKVNESLMNMKEMMLHQEKLKTAKTPEEAKELNEQFFETQVLKHAQAGTLEVLEGLYKAEAERPVEEVGEEYINNAKEAIKNLKSLERVYDNYEGYENKDELYFNRANDIRTSKYLQQAKIDQQQAAVDLGTKVNEIAKKYKFKTEREVLIKKNGQVVDTEKKSDEIPMPFSMMNLEDNTADTEENKAVYDKFLAEVQKLPEYKTSKELTNTLDAITKLKEDNNSEFEKLTSKEHQVKVAEEKRKQAIVKELNEKLKKANTVSEIEKLKASTEDSDFKKQADEKLAQVKEANKGAAANKAKDLLQKQFLDKINKVTLETVENLRDEIDALELSQERKTQLHEALDKKNNVLNGKEVEETEEDPLSMFTNVSEEEVKGTATSNDTTIPTDLPNPETEKTTVEAEVEEAAQKLLEQDGVVIGQDEKGNLIYSYNRTADGSDKGAFLSREFNQTENIGVIEREEFTNELTDNKQVLDPDFLLPGTALEIEVDTEYKGEKYKSDSTERETIQWELRLVELQQLAVDRGVALTALPEYIAEVPIKVTTKDGKTVFYVHDNAWYKAENIDNTAEAIKAQKDLNFQLRKKVIAGKQKSKITHKGPGKLFKSANNEQIAVSEAMPDTNLVLGVGKDKNGVMQTELPNDVETLLGKDATIIPTTIQNGRPYAIIKVGPNTYLPVALERSTLSQEVVDSIMFAIEAHLTNDTENPVVKAIADKSGLDILSTDGLAKYLNQFIYLYRTEGSEGLENVLINQSSKLKSTNFLLAVTANGIEFGLPGKQLGNSIKKGQHRLELSQNFKRQSPVALNALRENLKDMLANMSINDLKLDNNTVIVLDADGNTQTTKYKEFVKTSHTTNLLSVNVGTEEQPKWVYTIQPNITFDTSFAQTTGGKKATTTTVTTAQQEIKNKIEALDKTIENEFEEGDYRKVLVLAEKQVKDGTIPQTPENVQLITNYPKLFEELIKATDARNKTIEAFDKEKVLVGNPNKIPFYRIESTINEATGRLEIKWVEDYTEAVTNIQPIKIGNYAASQLLNYKEALQEELAKQQTTTTAPIVTPTTSKTSTSTATTDIKAKKADIERRRQEELNNIGKKGVQVSFPQIVEFQSTAGTFDVGSEAEYSTVEYTGELTEKDTISKLKSKSIKNVEGKLLPKTWHFKIPGTSITLTLSESKLKQGINTKYDAELAALGTDTLDIETQRADIVRRRQEDLEKAKSIHSQIGVAFNFKESSNALLKSIYKFMSSNFNWKFEERNGNLIKFSKESGNTEFNIDGLDVDVKGTATVMGGSQYNASIDPYDIINAKYDKELADIYKRYDKIISPLLEQLEASKPTAEEEVETATEEVLINEAVKNFTTADEISNISESINNGSIPLDALAQTGLTFSTKEEAVAFFNKVKVQFEKNEAEAKTSKLSNGRVVNRSKNKKDSEPISDETFEDDLPETLTQEQVDELKPETEGMIVRGISPSTQESLIAFLASDILKQTLSAKDVNRQQKVKAKPILEKHKKSFKELAKIYREDGLLNLAAQCDAIVEQFDKISKLTNQHMSVLVTGKVSEDINLDESEETVGLQKLVYNDDWTFTINALAGTSVDLKRFFSGIQLVDENGPVDNALEFPEMVSMNTVYNTLQEVLANKPSDFDTMMQVLELYTEKFPWFKSVIEELENGSEKVQNEFVTTMTKHSINMEFLMWSKDKNGNYVLRKWSSNSSSIEQRLRDIWESNLRGTGTKSNIVDVSEETGEYVFNKAELNQLIKTAETWMSYSDSEIANLPFDELATWLGNLGIVIQDKTYKDLKEGQFSNNGRLVWKALFTNDKGLVKVLTKSLQKIVDQNLTVAEAELLNDSVVKSLAKLDARNNLNTFSNSFQAGGKTIYSYGNNNYLVNRMRDLTMYDSTTGTFINQELINKLNSISFTKDSIWLKELQNSKELGEITRNSLGTNYLSLEALKKLFTQTQDNRKLNNLTSAEHEVIKIGFFQTGQGSIINGAERRLVSFFYPTMSDKSTMLSVRALAQQYKTEDGEIAKSNVNLLYEGLVLPEINRIRDKQPDNIKGYEANYFYFLPALNNLMITLSEDAEGNAVQKSFLDIVKDGDAVVYREDVREAVNTEIKNIFNQLVEDKLNDWEKLGIGQTLVDSKGRKTDQYTFLDKTYMSKTAKGGQGKPKVKYAASDYVFNYLIANAEAFKLFAGDPALYAKFKSESKYAKELNKAVEDLTEQDKQDLLKANLEETFINIGKRLAGDIAPGMELANSKDNNYYQVFLKDKELGSKNLKDSFQKEYFNKIINNYSDVKKGYGAMEGSDAQEYTTWKEHLYVLKQLGRLTTEQYNIINRKLTAQSEGKINANTKLSYDEVEIVLQPLKPVYVGNVSSVEDNVDRRVYIKSSSFPLIPEFTVGLQLEKVRKGLEKFEAEKSTEVNKDGSPIFVRASFGTANKVGAPLSSVDVFDNNGDVVDDFNVVDDNTLLLSRANFRIQQDVPYDREKDSVNIGTQERKLLFVNLLDVEIEDGVTGQDLLKVYNQTYKELFQYAQENLSKKLGLRQTVKTKLDLQTFMAVPTTTIFDTVEQVVADRGKLSAVKKTLLDSELNDTLKEYGDDTYDRVDYINKNFDKIVESLLSADNGIFTDKENYKKDC